MTKQTIAITRAVGVIGATIALVTGVTFAQLTSNTVTLTNNTLASATAQLQIKSGGGFDITDTGFDFGKLISGGAASSLHGFQLKNTGEVNMNITVTTGPLTVPASMDANKVKFIFARTGGAADTVTLAQL